MLNRRQAVVLFLLFSYNLIAMELWENLGIPQNWDISYLNNIPLEESNAEKQEDTNPEEYFQPFAETLDEDENDLLPLPEKTCTPKVLSTECPFFLDNEKRADNPNTFFWPESAFPYSIARMPDCITASINAAASSNFVSNSPGLSHLDITKRYAWPVLVLPPVNIIQPTSNASKQDMLIIEKRTGSERKRTREQESDEGVHKKPKALDNVAESQNERKNQFNDEMPSPFDHVLRPSKKPVLEALLKSAEARKGARFLEDVYSIEIYDLQVLHDYINKIVVKRGPTASPDSRIKSFQVWFEIPNSRSGRARPEKFTMQIKKNKKNEYKNLCNFLQITVGQ